MRLPWNKKYLIISFHIIITLLTLYFLKYCVDGIAYAITNLGIIFKSLKNIFSWIFSVFSVVIIAFLISYLLDPVVDFFQKKWNLFISNKSKKIDKNKGNSRVAGTIITFLTIIGSILLIIFLVINKIRSANGGNVIESISTFITNSVSDFSLMYKRFENVLIEYGVFEHIFPYISKFINSFTGFISNIGNIIINFISSFGNGLLDVLIGIVISFYFLKDKEKIKKIFNNVGVTFLPKKVYNFFKNSLEDINAVFSGYIRGQLLDATIMSILISIGLSIVKVKFAFIIGIVSGFSNIIPYFGALIGFIFAISVSLLTGEPMKAVYSSIVMIGLQQLDTIFIVPKVVGESVKLSPVLVIISLSVFGEIFGIWGLVFAVPIFATIKLFFSRIYLRRKNKLYIQEVKVSNDKKN